MKYFNIARKLSIVIIICFNGILVKYIKLNTNNKDSAMGCVHPKTSDYEPPPPPSNFYNPESSYPPPHANHYPTRVSPAMGASYNSQVAGAPQAFGSTPHTGMTPSAPYPTEKGRPDNIEKDRFSAPPPYSSLSHHTGPTSTSNSLPGMYV